MKRFTTTLFVLITLFVVSIALAMATHRSQDQVNPSTIQKAQDKEDKEKVPIVDYYSSEQSIDRNHALRSAKSRRYDNRNNIIELPEGVERTNDFVHWYHDIPPIPAAQSDVIVIGQVLSANAFLSNDKNYVYSEFTLTTEDLLKNDDRTPINLATTITAEREGGAVRFSSGRVQRYRINGQGMPQLGLRYVFFLKHNETDENLSILTGYELRDGQVFPLDTLDRFATYKGDKVNDFLDKVRRAAK